MSSSRTPHSVVLERALYAVAAPVLAVAPNLSPDGPAHAVNTAVALAGAAGAGGCVWAAKSSDGTGRKIVRLSPVVLAAAVDVAAVHTTGWGWDALAATVWAGLGWIVLPWSRSARRRHRPALAYAPAPQLAPATPEPEPDPAPAQPQRAPGLTGQVQELWERAGNPAGTVVSRAIRHEGVPHDLTVLLRAAEPGRPIGSLTPAAVAAAFGVDEDDVALEPVLRQDGRIGGPGWLEVSVTPDAAEARRQADKARRANPTDADWWTDRIGRERGPIPGSEFVRKIRDDSRGVTYWMARMSDEEIDPVINSAALCKALEVSPDDGQVFITEDGADILVAVWDISPLATVYPATRELLTPDHEGRWVVGYLASGQPARNRVYTERGAAHGLYVAPSGGGKTQLMALSVAADANFGAVVWLVTEAPDEKTRALGAHVDRQGVGSLFMVRALRAALALMEIRAEMRWADGELHDWTPGTKGCPYRPLSLYLDEFLSAARNEEYGEEIMDLAEQASVKGRKYGIGEKVAGQSVYVQDGFTQLLNENLRENSIPLVLKVAPKKIGDMFRALGASRTPPSRCPAASPKPPRAASTGS